MKKLHVIILAVLLSACMSAEEKTAQNNVTDQTPSNNRDDNLLITPIDGEEEVREKLDSLLRLSPSQLQMTRAVNHSTDLGYNPAEAEHLELIQDSALALTDEEMTRLEAHGFVLRDPGYPSFTYGYAEIYLEDLPIYISADSIIHAVHRSFDNVLKYIEWDTLLPALQAMINSMRQELRTGAADEYSPEIRADLDLYLAVGKSLLDGMPASPVAGADQTQIVDLVDKAVAANGVETTQLFGSQRELDFSQFKPRGHYTDSAELENYFRAMMWFGRIDFRVLEPNPETHELEFQRESLETAYALESLMTANSKADWANIDETIGLFVGESDYMTIPQLDTLLQSLELDSADQLGQKSDAEIAQVMQKYGFGTQRISSHYIKNGWRKTMPLSVTFAFFGQRYVVDSHVMSNVVYDRAGGGSIPRMMPDPLDVAYAALGNDQAVSLLMPQLQEYPYAPDLEAMRVLTDAHGDDYWNKNLYNSWMKALRALSPTSEISDPNSGLPAVARTEPWGRRVLNTQLASWAELRRDTILYAKQSYTSGASCEYPDAYVDPYPEFFAALADFAALGEATVAKWQRGDRHVAYFQNLGVIMKRLEDMARAQRIGEPLTQEQLDWVNEAVVIDRNCDGSPIPRGWYPQLIYGESAEFDPTIADVHTQPTEADGTEVGKVLHVGTGMARMMVVTIDTCTGPRAYVGLASSYYERITENFERLNDQEWSADISGSPDWLNDL